MRLYENKFSLATARKDRLMGPQEHNSSVDNFKSLIP